MLQLTTQYYLNARSGDASTAATIPYYREPGDTVTIDNIKIGTELEGNCIWYHSPDDDFFYWSGGFFHTDLLLENISFTPEEELEIYQSAVNELTGKYRGVPGYKGMAAGFKETGSQLQNVIALIIYVDKKIPANEGQIPDTINYRGIALVTDVRELNILSMLASNEADNTSPYIMGGTIAENIPGGESFGTRTLIVTKNSKDYLLACYHVACDSLFNQRKFNLVGKVTTIIPDPEISPGRDTFILPVVEGKFDSSFDYALMELGEAEFKNSFPRKKFNGFYNKKDLTNGFRKGMQLAKYGAATLAGKTGELKTYHAGPVEVDTQHGLLMNGLIEASNMADLGDSGAPVIDLSNNKLVGYIVAGNTTSTYILPFATLASRLSIVPKL